MQIPWKKVLTAGLPILALAVQFAADAASEKKQEELINQKVDEKVNQILNKKESK